MKLEEYFNALAPDDIRLKGTRIGIESILYEYIYRCKTPEEIAEQFLLVTLEQVYATILYYLHHRSEVDAYLADWLEFSRDYARRTTAKSISCQDEVLADAERKRWKTVAGKLMAIRYLLDEHLSPTYYCHSILTTKTYNLTSVIAA
ncbi:MAG: DUF433 domain-containing protein [Nostoc sp.]|uniref:DUF433 domain-containing protein n=1 Tax=Nostoc sp. TaxID=1180 RepID=UPI002FF8F1B0